jgi:hypothetical protein
MGEPFGGVSQKEVAGVVCLSSRNDDKSFLSFDTVFHVPDVGGISHMPSEEKLRTVKSELRPAPGLVNSRAT